MTDGENKQQKREITYQIGWKKGKMEVGANGKKAAVPESSIELSSRLEGVQRFFMRSAYRSTPAPSAKVLFVLLGALPIVSFLMTWVLVFGLGE
ncbi:hypothetical protein [Paenibacillus koleovorans]|uniref:hypothetical protein n=1 Tax=Paenibacillus koleovorans TaxID=121608 RepID=UPI000FD705EC|nr:hypothetical protein [Paenibacillus koleovorans]